MAERRDDATAPPAAPRAAAPPFLGRERELRALGDAYHSPEIAAAWIVGVHGAGKRTLARRALAGLAPAAPPVRFVRLREGTGETELALELMALDGPDARCTRHWPAGEARSPALELVGRHAGAGGVWVWEDAHHWLFGDGSPTRLLQDLLGTLEPGPRRLAVFTSAFEPRLAPERQRDTVVIVLGGLEAEHGVTLLRAAGAGGDDELLRRAAAEVDGHPLTLLAFGSRFGRFPFGLPRDRPKKAGVILASLDLEKADAALLGALAMVDGPIPLPELAAHLRLTGDELAAALARTASRHVLWVDELGWANVHPKYRENCIVWFHRRARFAERATDLAARVRRSLDRYAAGSRPWVRTLLSSYWLLSMAGLQDDATALRPDLGGTPYGVARELHRLHEFGAAIPHLELVSPDCNQAVSARLYLARCLSQERRFGEARQGLDELLAAYGETAYILRTQGRVEFEAEDFAASERYFDAARVLAPDYSALLMDIAHCRIRVGDWAGARAALAEESERRLR